MNEPFDPQAYRLAEHGDSRQRRWATRVLAHWPRYEELWRAHVVPLTFAVVEPGNYFVRPTLPEPLEELADAQYAVFFHVAQMHEWTVHLRNSGATRYIGGTEALYAYFSHGTSAIDATHAFADAVDAVLDRYHPSASPCFGGHVDERGHPCDLGPTWGMEGDRRTWSAVVEHVRRYRNWLVHRKPVFLQNELMPRVHYLDQMSGLTAISRVARDPVLLEERYEPALEGMTNLLVELERALDVVWLVALRALDAIDDVRYERERFAVAKEDRALDLEKILGVRGKKGG